MRRLIGKEKSRFTLIELLVVFQMAANCWDVNFGAIVWMRHGGKSVNALFYDGHAGAIPRMKYNATIGGVLLNDYYILLDK